MEGAPRRSGVFPACILLASLTGDQTQGYQRGLPLQQEKEEEEKRKRQERRDRTCQVVSKLVVSLLEQGKPECY